MSGALMLAMAQCINVADRHIASFRYAAELVRYRVTAAPGKPPPIYGYGLIVVTFCRSQDSLRLL
jgi:hypothetical protein